MKLVDIKRQIIAEAQLNSNFKKWFVGSKIKDGSNPKILYHGTSTNFDKFDFSKKRKGWLSKGFYFTEDKNDATTYGNIILSVYLNIKNPFIIKGDIANPDGTVEWAKDTKDQVFEMLPDARNIPWGDVSDLLEDNGYDGWVWGDWVVAFNPNQIKSTKNNGNWDTSDDNIYN